MAVLQRKKRNSTSNAKRASLFLMTVLSLAGVKLTCGASASPKEPSITASATVTETDPVAQFKSALFGQGAGGVYGSLSFSFSYPDQSASSPSVLSLSSASFGYAYDRDDKAFHLDGSLLYNGEEAPFLIHYESDAAYLSFLGARYSYAVSDFDALFASLTDIFGTEFVTIPDSFYEAVGSLLFSNEGGGALSLEGLDFSLADATDSSYSFALELPSPFAGSISFLTDKDYHLTSISASGLAYSDSDISFFFITDQTVASPSAGISSKAPSDPSSFTPIIDSMGLVERIADLAQSPKGLLKIEAKIQNETSFPGLDKEAQNESFDLTGELAFDWPNKLFYGDFVGGGYDLEDAYGTKSISFHNGVSDAGEWIAYLDYNEIMKISLDEITFNSFMALFEDEAGETGMSDKLLSSLEDAAAIKDAKEGRYEKILAAITSLESGSDTLRVVLSLKDFGMGDSSSLDLTLKGENKGLSQAIFTNLEIGTAVFDSLIITLDDYVEKAFDETDYFAYEGLPTLGSQMESLFHEKRAQISFTASIVDADGLGYPEISGNAYFDLNQKKGSAELKLLNQITSIISKNNHVLLDVTGVGDADAVRFHYNDGDSGNDGMKGQMAVKDLTSIANMAVDLYNDDDPRFSKFFDPIKLALASNAIGALSANRFGPFIATKVITDVSLSAEKWDFTLDGEAFGMDEGSSFHVVLGFVSDELSSIAIQDLSMDGNTINATITLESTAFDDASLSAVDLGDDYFRFDGIDVLLQSVLNEANRESFHLYSDSLEVKLSIISINAIDFDLKLDFYIYVKGEVVKVYGTVSYEGFPPSLVRRFDHGTISKNEKLVSSIYYDNIDPELTEQKGEETAYADQKGYLYVSQYASWQYLNWFEYKDKSETNRVKYSTDQLSDMTTVLNLIFYDILGVDIQKYYDKITSSDPAAIAYEKMLTKYEYANSGTPSWSLGIDLGVLANTDYLKAIEVSIQGTEDSYLSSFAIDNQTLLSVASLVTATASGTVYNGSHGKDYWTGDANDAWVKYLSTDGHRSDACTEVSW